MTLSAGRYTLGPDNGTLSVRTKKGGAIAKAGHDLLIRVTALERDARRRRGRTPAAIELSADSSSMRVIEGTGGMTSLGEDDKRGIAQTINEEVLKRHADRVSLDRASRPHGDRTPRERRARRWSAPRARRVQPERRRRPRHRHGDPEADRTGASSRTRRCSARSRCRTRSRSKSTPSCPNRTSSSRGRRSARRARPRPRAAARRCRARTGRGRRSSSICAGSPPATNAPLSQVSWSGACLELHPGEQLRLGADLAGRARDRRRRPVGRARVEAVPDAEPVSSAGRP